jgi:hypothetical protein
MQSMAKQTRGKLNQLEQSLPEGLLVDSAWLTRHGYSRSLQTQYVAARWLEQPTRGVYRRPRGTLSWQQAVISLQTVVGSSRPVVGGRTALELQGFEHYLAQKPNEVHLYAARRPPSWLFKLPINVRFVFHNDRTLFATHATSDADATRNWDFATGQALREPKLGEGLVVLPWGQWDWPLIVSAPERAVLELLNELPVRETFHQVDKLFEGLTNLSPRRLMALLVDCRSVKVKRLFFFFAARHSHAWFKRIDRAKVDLGTGKRMLAKGGRLDPATQITVPEDLDAVR